MNRHFGTVFQPNDGRVCENTADNILAANEGRLKVRLTVRTRKRGQIR